jgi:hypothetical protein
MKLKRPPDPTCTASSEPATFHEAVANDPEVVAALERMAARAVELWPHLSGEDLRGDPRRLPQAFIDGEDSDLAQLRHEHDQAARRAMHRFAHLRPSAR